MRKFLLNFLVSCILFFNKNVFAGELFLVNSFGPITFGVPAYSTGYFGSFASMNVLSESPIDCNGVMTNNLVIYWDSTGAAGSVVKGSDVFTMFSEVIYASKNRIYIETVGDITTSSIITNVNAGCKIKGYRISVSE